MGDLLFFAVDSCAKGVDDLFKYTSNSIDLLFDNAAVKVFLLLVMTIGGFLYVAGIGFACANFTLETRDDVNKSFISTIKNIFIGFACYSTYTTIPIALLQFTNKICSSLINLVRTFTFASCLDNLEKSGTLEALKDGLLSQAFNGPSSAILTIYVIIMFVCVCKVFFAYLKRGGILISLMFVGSFHLFSIPRGYTDGFWSWCKQIIGVCVTGFLQQFIISLSLMVVSLTGFKDIISVFTSAGIALSAAEVPRILQQFGLDTSMKSNISQAIFATSGIMHIASVFTGGHSVPSPSK